MDSPSLDQTGPGLGVGKRRSLPIPLPMLLSKPAVMFRGVPPAEGITQTSLFVAPRAWKSLPMYAISEPSGLQESSFTLCPASVILFISPPLDGIR